MSRPQAYPGDPEQSLVRRASLLQDTSRGLRDKGSGLDMLINRQVKDLDSAMKIQVRIWVFTVDCSCCVLYLRSYEYSYDNFLSLP